MPSFSYAFTEMRDSHAEEVMAILNHYVENGFAACHEQPFPAAGFAGLRETIGRYPAAVAIGGGNIVAGFAFLRPYHSAPAFARTAEIASFVHHRHTRRGLGAILLDVLIAGARNMGVDNIVARVSSLNLPGLAFHAKNGFKVRGRLPAAGRKLGKDFDVVYMNKILA